MTMVRRLCTAAVAEQNLSGNGREIVNRAGIYITCDEKETKASYRLHIPLQAYIKLGTQLRLAARHFGPSRSVEPNQTSSKFSSIRSVLVSNRNMKKKKKSLPLRKQFKSNQGAIMYQIHVGKAAPVVERLSSSSQCSRRVSQITVTTLSYPHI